MSGQVYIWLMDGVRLDRGGSPGTVPDPNWQIEGTGDMDGDGSAELIWRHALTGEVIFWFLGERRQIQAAVH